MKYCSQRTSSFYIVLVALLFTTACQQQLTPAPQPAARPLGLVEVDFNEEVNAQALISEGLRFFNPSTSFEAINNICYLSTSFTVTNTTGAALNNLTLIAIHRSSTNTAGTAIGNVRSAVGNSVTDESIYRAFEPANRVVSINGQAEVVAGAADFQAFLPADLASLQADLEAIAPDATLLEYGFVARNAAGSRRIENGETGSLTIAVQYPCATGIAGGTPFRFSMTFALTDVDVPRFTRGPNETTAELEQRIINAYGATQIPANLEIMLIGNDSDTPTFGNLIRVSDVATNTSELGSGSGDSGSGDAGSGDAGSGDSGSGDSGSGDSGGSGSTESNFNSGVPKFTPASTATEIIASGASSITIGNNAIYVGTWQRTANDQDPLVASINTTTNTINWLRNDYESVPPDGRANGILVTPTGEVYVAFSVDGGSNNYNFAAGGGWLNSYGQGGGPKVGILVEIDPANGTPLRGTFITAVLNSGNTNSLNINALNVDGSGNIIVSANTAAAPRYEDTNRMPCPDYDGSVGVQDYTLVLRPDLASAVSATAPSCNNPLRN
ncbi:MAG: hypothetical protein AAF267_11095 [Deinococcota bacterium]